MIRQAQLHPNAQPEVTYHSGNNIGVTYFGERGVTAWLIAKGAPAKAVDARCAHRGEV
jgi:hypothetical protein